MNAAGLSALSRITSHRGLSSSQSRTAGTIASWLGCWSSPTWRGQGCVVTVQAGSGVGADSPDGVVVGPVPPGVLRRQLGLAYSAGARNDLWVHHAWLSGQPGLQRLE